MKLLSKLLISAAALGGIGWVLKKVFSEHQPNTKWNNDYYLDEDAEDFAEYDDINDDV